MSPVTDRGPLAGAGGRRRRAREPVARGQLQVTVSELERAQLRARADELGVSVPRLLVESALADEELGGGWAARREAELGRRQELAELNELRYLLATIANNVNQLAHVANISGDLPGAERIAGTLDEVDRVLEQLRELSRRR